MDMLVIVQNIVKLEMCGTEILHTMRPKITILFLSKKKLQLIKKIFDASLIFSIIERFKGVSLN